MKVRAASDQAILAYLGDEIGQAAHERVFKLLRLLQQVTPRWMPLVPPYNPSAATVSPGAELQETARTPFSWAGRVTAPAPGEPCLFGEADIASLALYLASDRGKGLTGHVFEAEPPAVAGGADPGLGLKSLNRRFGD